MSLQVKDWNNFQHYKNRRPPWIKLYRELLDTPGWFDLSGDEAKALINLWLIASETNDGSLPASDVLAFRLRVASNVLADILNSLVSKGFIVDASNVLAPCYQDASAEREGEGETDQRDNKSDVSVSDPSVLDLNWCTSGGDYKVDPVKLAQWVATYPSVDVAMEIKKAWQWHEDNPSKRKTKKGMPRFLGSWLARKHELDSQSSGESKQRCAVCNGEGSTEQGDSYVNCKHCGGAGWL
jgi:hypothetical protein